MRGGHFTVLHDVEQERCKPAIYMYSSSRLSYSLNLTPADYGPWSWSTGLPYTGHVIMVSVCVNYWVPV